MNKLMTSKRFLLAAFASSISISLPAAASCGSAYCVLNTQWDTQGMVSEPGRFTADLRYEYIKQDQLRHGRHNISAAEDTSDAVELKTVNQNLVASLDYTFDRHWGIAASLPMVKREHTHIEDPGGAAELHSWDFSRTGDARVLGRYQFDKPSPTDSFGLQFGLKLPTGSYRLSNAEGAVAERALQPGTGSTDLILGGYYAYRPQYRGLGWFGQVLYQRAISTQDQFRPGNQWSVSGGINYPVGDSLTLLFQVNGLIKARDSGANAEPELSGGRYVYATPGLSYAISPTTQIYGFVQLPLLQDVNGVQLVARQAFVAGMSMRF